MLASLCIANKRAGQAPLVVSLQPGGSQYERLVEAGVRVVDLNMRSGTPSLGALWRLARLIRDERPSVIQAWMYHADLYALWALVLSGRAWRTRLYSGIRCSEMDFAHYPLTFRLGRSARRHAVAFRRRRGVQLRRREADAPAARLFDARGRRDRQRHRYRGLSARTGGAGAGARDAGDRVRRLRGRIGRPRRCDEGLSDVARRLGASRRRDVRGRRHRHRNARRAAGIQGDSDGATTCPGCCTDSTCWSVRRPSAKDFRTRLPRQWRQASRSWRRMSAMPGASSATAV